MVARATVRIGIALGVITAVVIAGCGSSEPGPSDQPATDGTGTSAVSPLTGEPVDLTRPVIVVKIDNVAEARPPTGLSAADVVYVEMVEGGETRLAAVYQSELPPVVGPVRSVRTTDLELLANYGRPTLAFSGEAPELSSLIASSPVLDASAPAQPGAYFHSPQRQPPFNTYVRPAELPAGTPPRDIGFRFGPTTADGTPVVTTSVRYPETRIGLTWRPEAGDWMLTMDGTPVVDADGSRVAATTVVAQRVHTFDSDIRDASGAPSPVAETVGTGPVTVWRDGMAFDGGWQRPAADQPTHFTDTDGAPLAFAPGPVWILLVRR